MIDIIIPAYNAHEYIERALNSIIIQTMIDKIHICIVDDNSDKTYDEIVNKYKKIVNIKLIRNNENKGPGISRTIGIKNTNSKYIVFIDADDQLYNSYSIQKLYKCIDKGKYDEVYSKFIVEKEDKDMSQTFTSVWLHGKIYKRSFIEKNNICFNNYYYNEDLGFNKLIELLTDNIFYLNETTYIWRYVKGSLTRKDNSLFEGVKGYIDNVIWAINEAEKRNVSSKRICKLILEVLVDNFAAYTVMSNDKIKNEIKKQIVLINNIYNNRYVKNDINLDEIINKEKEIYDNNELINKDNFEKFLNEL